MTSPRSAVPGLTLPAVPDQAAAQALALQWHLERTERLPPDALRAAQAEQLGALLRHARDHVPALAANLATAGIVPDGPVDPDALRALPVLTRARLQDAGEGLRATAVPREHGRVGSVSTSGSSGAPVTVHKTELQILLWRAITLREHLWHRRDLRATSAMIRWTEDPRAAAPHGLALPDWGSPTRDVFATGPGAVLSITSTPAEQAAWLRQVRPTTLLTYPSALAALLDHVEAEGGVPRGITQVRTISEAVPDGLRERCASVLGARLVDLYSSQEVGYIALQCPDHDHLHVQSEMVIVEVLRDDGTPCGPGEIGRVIVTPLHAFAMPLLRYDLGDMAEVGPSGCTCGRTLPILRRVVGRVRGMLRFPDGRRAWPLFGGQDFRTVAPIRQWQAEQTAIDHVVLHLVVDRPLTDAEADALVALARARSGWTHTLTLLPRDTPIPRGPSGKFADFVTRLA